MIPQFFRNKELIYKTANCLCFSDRLMASGDGDARISGSTEHVIMIFDHISVSHGGTKLKQLP